MHRAQIILEEWQHEALKSLAEREGKSISAVVRQILTAKLGRRKSKKLESIMGIGTGSDISGRDHDRALYDDP
ncbi:MAG: hypothetical protein JRG91_15450 [Deltaproteobacteria bacterium]|nr:hypothetical protein [Deltaproteobacteria bacterium]